MEEAATLPWAVMRVIHPLEFCLLPDASLTDTSFMVTSVWVIAGILIFAGASFFFALAESALFSLSSWQKRQLAGQASQRSGAVLRLLERPQDLLATIVLGNTFANSAILAIGLWAALGGGWSPAATLAAVLALLMLVLLGCETVPKTLGVRAPEVWAARVARPMSILLSLTGPLRHVAQALNIVILRVTVPRGIKPKTVLSEEEYQELLDLAYQQGTLAQSEKEIILQIINLDRRAVKDVMRPRAQMASISDELSVEDMIAAARRHKHRRLPIYDATPDTIVGILNTRALLLDPQIDLADAIEFPSFVPESMNLLQLFKSLQRQQRGLAIVLDEYGGTAGLVTIEDILEEIIGEVRREGEEQGFIMEKLGTGRWRVNATMRLDDFRREYPALGEAPDIDTIGGLFISQLQVVPAAGESVAFRDLKLTAIVADERRVREVLVEAPAVRGGG